MFYWKHQGINIVLSNEDEMKLVRRVAENAHQVVGYTTRLSDRRLIETRIFRLLKTELLTDRSLFLERYAIKHAAGPEALDVFRMLLIAYARITRLAALGDYCGPDGNLLFNKEIADCLKDIAREVGQDDRVDEDDYTSHLDMVGVTRPDAVVVSLFGRGLWPWQNPRPTGKLIFPKTSILKAQGMPNDFDLITEEFTARFGPRRVDVEIVPSTLEDVLPSRPISALRRVVSRQGRYRARS